MQHSGLKIIQKIAEQQSIWNKHGTCSNLALSFNITIACIEEILHKSCFMTNKWITCHYKWNYSRNNNCFVYLIFIYFKYAILQYEEEREKKDYAIKYTSVKL